MRVKGTFLMNFVKTIRANRDKDYSGVLEPGDWEIINSRILASQWYPFDNFRRIAIAAFQVIGEGKLGVARDFGKLVVREQLKTYANVLIVAGDPSGTIDRFVSIQKTFFDGGVKLEVREKNTGCLTLMMDIHEIGSNEVMRKAFYEVFAGIIETTIEAAGSRLKKVEYQEENDVCKFLIMWDDKTKD